MKSPNPNPRGRRRGRPPHDDLLTPAEWRIANAVRHGMTSRQIATRRGISVEAVKYHVANILQKLSLKDRKALRQWHGAPKDSAHNSQEKNMTDTTIAPDQLGPIGQIARNVDNIETAERWYRDVLGLPHLFTFGNMAFFDCDGTRLMLTETENDDEAPSVLYFRVSDIEATHAVLTKNGVDFINAPHMIHKHEDGVEEWMAFLNDPQGRSLGLMSQTAKRD